MQVFKFIILFSIWALSTYIGIAVSKKYTSRAQSLKEFKSALNILETKIKFTYETLPEIFVQIAKGTSKNIAKTFETSKENMKNMSTEEAWKNAVENCMTELKKEDINVLNGLGKLLR